MRNQRVEVRFRRQASFDCAHETIQSMEAVELFSIADPRAVERIAEKVERGVVSLQRHLERVTVFAAVRERKARRIVKAAGRAMNHLGYQPERFQSPRPESFQQQKLTEIMSLTFVRT